MSETLSLISDMTRLTESEIKEYLQIKTIRNKDNKNYTFKYHQ